MNSYRNWACIALVAALAGCATAAHPRRGDTGKQDEKICTLAEIVASVAEKEAGNLVLMNGIQDKLIAAPEFDKAHFQQTAERLAASGGCIVKAFPDYTFIYPAGYEALLSVSLAGKLDEAHQAMRVPLTLGFDTPLYAAFALLGRALNTTIVGDQIITAAKAGSMTFGEIPLQSALEALLQSARVVNEGFEVESSPGYVFIYSKQNAARGSMLLNADKLTPEQNAALDAHVNVILPSQTGDAANLKLMYGAQTLHAILPELSKQLKMNVTAEPEILRLPVTTVLLRDLPIRTAMDLFIRQWPIPRYGYEFVNNEIHLVVRK
jgi:hypothetical protein